MAHFQLLRSADHLQWVVDPHRVDAPRPVQAATAISTVGVHLPIDPTIGVEVQCGGGIERVPHRDRDERHKRVLVPRARRRQDLHHGEHGAVGGALVVGVARWGGEACVHGGDSREVFGDADQRTARVHL